MAKTNPLSLSPYFPIACLPQHAVSHPPHVLEKREAVRSRKRCVAHTTPSSCPFRATILSRVGESPNERKRRPKSFLLHHHTLCQK